VSDLLMALAPVVKVLQDIGVRYFVGGSLASSAHGMARASLDVDLIAELDGRHAPVLAERLHEAYYLDASRIETAIRLRRSFNLIHLATMFKIDVFVAKGRPFDAMALQRATPETLGDEPEAPVVPMATAEDIVLAKLEWFEAGGRTSERQWTDVVGVLKLRQSNLDPAYLRRWAAALGVDALLEQALAEAASDR
jgi:hypothetical protein